jgi:predicted ATPase
MRIAFSGAACTGKTTTIEAFLAKWPNYKKPEASYRSLIKENNHSKKTDKKTQREILEFMVNQQNQYTLHDCVVFDRCGLDNIAYTLWCYEKGKKGFSRQYVDESIELVRESMKSIDIIFLLTRDLMGPIENNNIREIDPSFVSETDNIFKAIYSQLSTTGASPFFPHNDSPALIEVKGTVEERINLVSMYVNPEGHMYGEEQSLVNMDEIAKMESLLREQQQIATKEKGIL